MRSIRQGDGARSIWQAKARGVPCVLIALRQAESVGWSSPAIWGALLVGVVALATFLRVELRKPRPLLKVGLFANRMFALAAAFSVIGLGLSFFVRDHILDEPRKLHELAIKSQERVEV